MAQPLQDVRPLHVAVQVPAPQELGTDAPHVAVEVVLVPVVSGKVVPAFFFDAVLKARNAYRAKH